MFSYQLHDVPYLAQGQTPKVLNTLVSRQWRRNLIYASHRHGTRPQNMPKILHIGPAAILDVLSAMGPHVHGYNAPFVFEIQPVRELEDVFMLVVHGKRPRRPPPPN